MTRGGAQYLADEVHRATALLPAGPQDRREPFLRLRSGRRPIAAPNLGVHDRRAHRLFAHPVRRFNPRCAQESEDPVLVPPEMSGEARVVRVASGRRQEPVQARFQAACGRGQTALK